jgi:hypothetical protein
MDKSLGKTVRIFLADGKPSGLLIAEIMNWTGQVYLIPRSQLNELSKRDALKKTGLYILVGLSEENYQKEKIYIGEADNVYKRLAQHDTDEKKDFWNRAIVIISKDENLTKSHVRYLEGRLLEISKKANRAEIENSNFPDLKSLPEPEMADMEFFLDQVILMLPILGLQFAKSIPTSQENTKERPTFVYNGVGTKATAQEIDGEFVVFKGSTARKKGTPSWRSYKSLRDQLIKEGKLVGSAKKDYYVFNEDVAFASPSAAAAVIYAGNQNGRKTWKLKGSNKTYRQWQEEKLKRT